MSSQLPYYVLLSVSMQHRLPISCNTQLHPRSDFLEQRMPFQIVGKMKLHLSLDSYFKHFAKGN